VTTATTGPVRKPDGTGRIHNRLGPSDGAIPGATYLACRIWGAWQYEPVPAASVRDEQKCRRCWPGATGASTGEGE
jgi:hypothetical protein